MNTKPSKNVVVLTSRFGIEGVFATPQLAEKYRSECLQLAAYKVQSPEFESRHVGFFDGQPQQ